MTRVTRRFRSLATSIGMVVAVASAWAIELPAEMVAGLLSEKFAERQSAQADLLGWARQQAPEVMEEFYRQSRTAGEPEVRERCLAVLAELVGDEYLRGRPGYLGVKMDVAVKELQLPGEAKLRYAIRLDHVEPESPAAKAGLVVGDLLVGINGRTWTAEDTPQTITGWIKGFKNGEKVTVWLARENKLVEVPVALGGRPAIADQQILIGPGVMLGPGVLGGGVGLPDAETVAAAERMARQEYFREWLARKKGKTP